MKRNKYKNNFMLLFSQIYIKFPIYYVIIFLHSLFNAFLYLLGVAFPPMIIDAVLNRELWQIFFVVLAFLSAKLITEIILHFIVYIKNNITTRIDQHFNRNFRMSIMNAPMSFIEQSSNQNGIEYADNCYKYYANGVEGIFNNLSVIISNIFIVAGVFGVIGKYGLVLLGIIPFIFLDIYLQNKINQNTAKSRGNISKYNRSRNYMYYEFTERKFGTDIRLFSASRKFLSKVRSFNDMLINIDEELIRCNNKYILIKIILSHLINGSYYIFSAFSLFMRKIDIPFFTALISSYNQFQSSVSECIRNIQEMKFKIKYLNEYVAFQSKLSEQKVTHQGEIKISSIDTIEFENVCFKYPNTNNNILKSFNVKIDSGEKLAVVGLNGSGKTTFIKLLTSLYYPDSGKILINNYDAANISKSSYLNRLTAVFQDFQIFAFSVKDNLLLDDPNKISDDKVDDALKLLGLKDIVYSLKNGLETNLSKQYDDDGTELSGGEQQKLAIARAWLRNADVIILDEPTAALDPIAEYEVYFHFNTIAAGKTAIYVSHRLSACKFADRIAVMDNGNIKELGTHDELIKLNGIYSNMYQTQAQYYN